MQAYTMAPLSMQLNFSLNTSAIATSILTFWKPRATYSTFQLLVCRPHLSSSSCRHLSIQPYCNCTTPTPPPPPHVWCPMHLPRLPLAAPIAAAAIRSVDSQSIEPLRWQQQQQQEAHRPRTLRTPVHPGVSSGSADLRYTV